MTLLRVNVTVRQQYRRVSRNTNGHPERHYICLTRHGIKVSVSNEITTVCTMQRYKPTVSIEVSVGVCILSQCILTEDNKKVQ
jgi:hypothetical protein